MRKFRLGLALFSIIAIAIFAIGLISAKTSSESTKLLQESLEEAIVNQYALEGRYPASLQELLSDESIHYDAERYIVRYEVLAENLRPRIIVIERGGN
ncbi:hypothetical protein [Dubosiella newyorkensis]|uniref:Uncharacterized protein n=1 Tax=Dubosiella newyorkensis TaxID=1862672 RepID=A0A1U7NM93_9FIRM|nr:hypothetical protein [Dubosiella newyorkensis]OLU46249.1 hypothetical protein BO225_07145 [Dubosiella newyorkensis]